VRAIQGSLRVKAREHGDSFPQARDGQRGRKCPAELIDSRLEPLEARAKLVFEVVRWHLVEALGLGLERPHVALDHLRRLLERVTPLEGLSNADDLLHGVDVVVVVPVGRRLDEPFLGPVDELPRRDVADPRGLRGRQAQTCEYFAVVSDQDLC
jgi:hypothetical protein